MIVPISIKVPNVFTCINCHYTTSRKSQYERHIGTRKHQRILNGSKNDSFSSGNKIYKCSCGKIYKYDSGYYRHKKICDIKTIEETHETKQEANSDLIIQLLKQNQELQNTIIEMIKKPSSVNTNCNNNNSFNINLFLNEKCKDAMNITDFVHSLKLTLKDLEKTGELGYVKGITNIILNGLNKMDIYKRPIHCSDLKRETLYVKDKDIWEKENENKKKIKNAIKHISSINAKQVTAWTKENKGYDDYSSKKNDKYMKIISEANGGEDEEINKIISNIASIITIDKQLE